MSPSVSAGPVVYGCTPTSDFKTFESRCPNIHKTSDPPCTRCQRIKTFNEEITVYIPGLNELDVTHVKKNSRWYVGYVVI